MRNWQAQPHGGARIGKRVYFYPGMGLQLGYLSFPTIKINVMRQVHMYYDLSVKINMQETPHGVRRLGTHLVCACFHVCGRQKLKYLLTGASWLTTPLHRAV